MALSVESNRVSRSKTDKQNVDAIVDAVLERLQQGSQKSRNRRDFIRYGLGAGAGSLVAYLISQGVPQAKAITIASGYIDLDNQASLGTPATGKVRVGSLTTKRPAFVDETGAGFELADAQAASYIIAMIGGTCYARPAPNSGLSAFSGVDAATVINNAIQALPIRTNQMKLSLRGAFTISTPIDVSDYTILDLTQAALTLANGVNDSVIKVHSATGGYYVNILGGYIDGNKANQTAGYCVEWGGSNGLMRGTYLINGYDGGINVEAITWPNSIENVFSELNIMDWGNGGVGVVFANNATDNFLHHSVLAQRNYSGFGISIRAAGNIVDHNHIYCCYDGIFIENKFGIILTGNYIESNKAFAIEVEATGAFTADHISIVGCFFWNNGINGVAESHIKLNAASVGNCFAISVIGNTFLLSGITPPYCISGANVDSIEIIGNSFMDGYLTAPTSLTGTKIDIAHNSGDTSITAPSADLSYCGPTIQGTAGETTGIGDVCYMKNDGKYWKAKADAAGTASAVVMATGTINANATGLFLLWGLLRNDAGWGGALTVGGMLFLSDATSGAITQLAPTTSGHINEDLGYAYGARTVYFDPNTVTVIVA